MHLKSHFSHSGHEIPSWTVSPPQFQGHVSAVSQHNLLPPLTEQPEPSRAQGRPCALYMAEKKEVTSPRSTRHAWQVLYQHFLEEEKRWLCLQERTLRCPYKERPALNHPWRSLGDSEPAHRAGVCLPGRWRRGC